MRERLLEQTVRLLHKRPGRRPTTAELARQAHVSVGTVYRYFADMDAIIAELRYRTVQEITTGLSHGVVAALDLEPQAAMVAVVEALTTAFEDHAPVLRVAIGPDDTDLGVARAEVEEPLEPLARILPARLRPDLAPAELDDLVFLTMGAAANLCLRIALLRPPQADRQRLVDAAARMLLAAFTPPDPNESGKRS